MKIALVQMNSIIGDIQGNKEKILSGYRKGIDVGADIVICPELALPGYPPQDLVEKREFREAVFAAAGEISLNTTQSTALLFGSLYEEIDSVGTNLFNVGFFCHSGSIQFIQRKTLIPNYDVFDEMRYFESAKSVSIYEWKGEKLGISICEDIWNDKDYWKKRLYPNDPVEVLIKQGATLLLNISASPYSYGKRTNRKEMLSTLTNKDKLPLAYACCVGAQTDLIFDGTSMCFDANGNLNAIGKRYEEDFFVWDTTLNQEPIGRVENAFEVEVLDALTLGVKDYFSKNRISKALVGLSGGIDSALVTYIAVRALGAENVSVVMMPSKYSSDHSVSDSEQLIKNLGIKSDLISIQPVVDVVTEMLTPAFKGKPADLTEENLQSRTRGLYLMALSNKHGYLLLTTGNKSEMATGYATLYGDMCGALAVIADVYKTDVYRLCNYINKESEIIPQSIIDKAPSAELRPDQKDQDSLPPYDVLDTILRMYLEENKELEEISLVIGDRNLVRKTLRMVDFNEFKRKQAAPALRVSPKAFGYGRRFPIVQKWRS